MNVQSVLQSILSGFNQHSRYWVAFSGGLDSTVLLHLLKSAGVSNLSAIHVNHQISPNANQWQQHCEIFCSQYAISLHSEKVIVEKRGYGLEDAARNARYAVFASVIKKDDLLFTAHHADDQVETLLLRLLRGTGIKGLAGIAAEKDFHQGKIIRPLLSVNRSDLLGYAQKHKLTWIEDESNLSDIYDRNYLRLHVMPFLEKRWTGFQKKWQQTAKLCADTDNLLSEFAQMDLQSVNRRSERVGQSIDRKHLTHLSRARQQNLLRYWLLSQGYTIPEQQHWQHIFAQLFSENPDAQVNVQWGNVSLRLYQHRIYALPMELPIIQLHQSMRQAATGEYLLQANLPDIRIETRRGSERCRPAQRAHSQTLKKLLQEYQLEPWLRDQVPLIYSGDHLVAVGDLWICAGYVAEEGQAAIKLYWGKPDV